GFPLKNRREAQCLIHYIQELASWVDICDPSQNFRLEVPKQATQFPLLAYSILAFSSRHLELMIGKADQSCEDYHSMALRLLIPILDDPVGALNENLLAAVVLLRLYEEMSEVDASIHLIGSSRLLNGVSNFAAQGGLGEAASWIVLRQDLHVSLVKSEPMRLNLESYNYSESYNDVTDAAFANRIIHLCCKVVAYGTSRDTALDRDTWTQLREGITAWHESIPWQFRPYYADDNNSDSQQAKTNSVFPSQLNDILVLGFQHYYLAKAFLDIFDPRAWNPGFEAVEHRQTADKSILANLRMATGIAIQNASVVGAQFTIHHTLHACGTYFKSAAEQQEILGFLNHMSKTTGWPTKRLRDKLIKVWYKS
ncbi:hypothetical protein EDB81DRAFT_632211, partial [Dactylonectria macrodidyma]